MNVAYQRIRAVISTSEAAIFKQHSQDENGRRTRPHENNVDGASILLIKKHRKKYRVLVRQGAVGCRV